MCLYICVCAHTQCLHVVDIFTHSSPLNRLYIHTQQVRGSTTGGQNVQHMPAQFTATNLCHGSICCQGQQGITRALLYLVWSCMFVRSRWPVLLVHPICPLPTYDGIHTMPHTYIGIDTLCHLQWSRAQVGLVRKAPLFHLEYGFINVARILRLILDLQLGY